MFVRRGTGPGVSSPEIFNGAIWCILKCNLEENNVMKINNIMCKNILFIIIITHINKSTTIIYSYDDQILLHTKKFKFTILSSVIAIQSLT